MKEPNINETIYPAAKFNRTLNLEEANHQMYLFMGEHVYSSFYKMVREDAVPRLEAVVERCAQLPADEHIDECIPLINQQGGYDTFMITIQKYSNSDSFFIELKNVAVGEKMIQNLEFKVNFLKSYLTVNGKAMFGYKPSDDSFHLFWADYEQIVDVCRMSLTEWRKQILKDGYVVGKDSTIFESFCDSLQKGDRDQVFVFSGKILSNGKDMDGYRVRMTPRNYNGERYVIGIWSVISIKTAEEADDYLEGTYVDSLTRILNKRAITDYAQKAVKPGRRVALAVLDIDYFKNVNDTYGHLFGDQVIAATADVIKKAIGENGMAGRMGGDEFMIILENYEGESELRSYLRSIKNKVAMLFLDRVGNNRLSCSIGVAQCGIDSEDFNELFKIADKALYIAKQKGRNRFVIYHAEKHGQFHMKDDSFDLTEIRDSYYAEKDMFKMNKLLAESVLKGRECLEELLEQAVRTLMVDRITISWGEKREVIAAYPLGFLWEDDRFRLLEDEKYRELFRGDLLIITNTNSMEYSSPEVFSIFRERGVLSFMQFLLRDASGNICGTISLEECQNRKHFPKLAVQLFENMCRIVNAVLIKEVLSKGNSSAMK